MRYSLIAFFICLSGLLLAQSDALSDRAIAYVTSGQGSFLNKGINAEDVRISNQYTDKTTGVTHVYLEQLHDNIRIHNAVSGVHFLRDGRVFHDTERIYDLADFRIQSGIDLSSLDALESTRSHFGLQRSSAPEVLYENNDRIRSSSYSDPTLSLSDILTQLEYVADGNTLKLCWNVQLTKADDHFMWNVYVDASNGAIVSKNSWTVECHAASFPNLDEVGHDHDGHLHDDHAENHQPAFMNNSYNVWPLPGESPQHIARSLEVEPWLAAPNASPFGWHDTDGVAGPELTITSGNNVFAYEDRDGNGIPGFSPDGGPNLIFDHPIDLAIENPVMYTDVAVTNLFYMNNIIHDVLYQYGFDEVAGNFQENNYGNGGAGSDPVNAEAQSGADIGNANNAFMGTPPDGFNPTMMMFEFTFTNPRRDSDLDNGIIQHEYGHGWSNRLTAGPANVNCLRNQEQMGEGWSDYLTLIFGMDGADMPEDRRGVGTWALGQPLDGDGVRQFPYTTDLGINPHTYADISGVSIPHGVGSIWCAMLWEMTWGLVEEHGWDPDIYNGTGGNNIALKLVNDGMALQPCSPGFVDGRDAILAADMALTGGENQCIIWDAFAKRGLGLSASQGSSGSVFDGTEAFDVPACATCEDGEQNGDETGVDCGGSTCMPCPCTQSLNRKVYVNESVPDGTDDRVNFLIEIQGGVDVPGPSNILMRAGSKFEIDGEFTVEEDSEMLMDIEDCEEIAAPPVQAVQSKKSDK